LAEMVVKSGTGCRLSGIAGHMELFGEGPSRVVVSVPPENSGAVAEMAHAARVPATELGLAGGERMIIEGLLDVTVAEAEAAWKGALPAAFSVP